jgi:Zn-dependent M28 family amino/carboxypeptidase
MDAETTPVRLKAHVDVLAGVIGEHNIFHPQALQAVADYIKHEWRNQGYEVVVQEFDVNGVCCANMEVTCPGSSREEEIILLGAHYDSVRGSPGANDNGSGVAALLELSRLFTQTTPKMTVRFVAFVNEEAPFFGGNQMGSWVYARAARHRGDAIHLMVSLETLGFYSSEPGSQGYPPLFRYFHPDRGDFIAFVSNLRSRRVMLRAVKAFRAHSDFPVEHTATFTFVPGVGWSDHYSFWERGYRAFMVTDTAFYRYAWYHSPQDTPDKLCYPPFARVTNGLFGAFAKLAR